MDNDLFKLLKPTRITEIVDIGANPIDGDVPYEPVANLTSKKIPKKLSRKLLKVLS